MSRKRQRPVLEKKQNPQQTCCVAQPGPCHKVVAADPSPHTPQGSSPEMVRWAPWFIRVSSAMAEAVFTQHLATTAPGLHGEARNHSTGEQCVVFRQLCTVPSAATSDNGRYASGVNDQFLFRRDRARNAPVHAQAWVSDSVQVLPFPLTLPLFQPFAHVVPGQRLPFI